MLGKFKELLKNKDTTQSFDMGAFEKDPAVDQVIENPEILSYTTLLYEIKEHGGKELKQGHKLIFSVPEPFRKRIVRDVVLRHRKSEKYSQNISQDGYDPNGAYSLVEIHDTYQKEWVGWQDPEGYNPVKFAEPRPASDPENENLHDWVAMVGQIKPDAFRVTNVGKNPELSVSQIHGLEVVFFPELENVQYRERIYCSGTEFIDLEKNQLLPSYGGGERTGGVYKDSVVLNGSDNHPFEVNRDPGVNIERYQRGIKIKLEAGQLVQAEIAVGDTQYLGGEDFSDKKVRLGWAKLWVGIKRNGLESIEWFIKNANVPPQGVIAGGPHIEQSQIKEGDELIIESRADTSYLMGWRLAYKSNIG